MARLLMEALRLGGHEVMLASRLRSHAAHPAGHEAVKRDAEKEVARLLGMAPRPELWFTYHLYYKAPDWIGPSVAAAFDIPYVVAEASHAPKRAAGPWADSHAAAAAAIRAAAAICAINPADSACVGPLLDDPARLVPLPPFLESSSFERDRAAARAALLQETGFAGDAPIAVTVAMMRPGDKRESYRVLAEALKRARDGGCQLDLVVIGDGVARGEIERDFAALPDGSVHFLGARDGGSLPRYLAGGDLFLWPAIREAYGMAVLEAQAAGLPVIAGDSGGVSAIVRHGETGLLTPEGDVPAFAAAIAALAGAPERRQKMGRAASRRIAAHHTLDVAAVRLNAVIDLVKQRRAA